MMSNAIFACFTSICVAFRANRRRCIGRLEGESLMPAGLAHIISGGSEGEGTKGGVCEMKCPARRIEELDTWVGSEERGKRGVHRTKFEYLTRRLPEHHEEYVSTCALWYSTVVWIGKPCLP